jgi:threonine/homoserine/homoserine lactone efflux protein
MNLFLLLIKAVVIGIATGFVMSIPIGPSGIESVKRTLSKNYFEGFKVSLGAISADLLYLFLINGGLANLLNRNRRTEAIFWIISGLLLSFIGYNSLINHNGNENFINKLMKNSNISSLSFVTGFMITVSNPMTPSIWLTMSGTVLKAWYHISKLGYYVFIFSLILGMVLWFALLNFLAYKGFNVLSPQKSKSTVSVLMWGIIATGFAFIIWGFYIYFNFHILHVS